MSTPPHPRTPSGDPPDSEPSDTEPSESASPAVWSPPDAAAAPADPVPPPPPPATPPPGSVPDASRPPAPAEPRQTNRLAIATLVTGLLGLIPLTIAIGIAALVVLRRSAEKGRNLAIGGLVAALVWGVIAVASATGVFLPAFTVERDESGAITDGGTVHLASLRKGDCYTGFAPDAEDVMFVKAVPCTEPHRGEITARLPAGTAAEFGTGTPFERADLLCQVHTEWTSKSRFYDDLQPYLYLPEPGGGLTLADREEKIVCAMHYTASGTLGTPLADTLDADRRLHDELRVGDCMAEIDTGAPSKVSGSVTLLPCDEPHRYQMYAAFDVPASITGKAPAQRVLDQEGQEGCDKRWNAALKNAPDADYEMLWITPTELSWYGSPEVICLVGAVGGAPLTKSIVGG
ncbi:DUF4190 domain-containing protein [Actinomadura sp. WMMB 499]|uniref:DUF4190 domain-containing protein n=1 Tax=Actinomadura sp. WMMB 499 TaxID=1219491 RepID=UPI0012493227|nr:DUF4190 domain-containing protein [Actinomadura sp. WMMB 499]QFG25690.1 hypothetical protein F7P10_35645 [Actinomadura sp. WMMB 499]